ncbi:MAG: hypothetical protein XD95_0382, partial [Microgenomates bacterium 39_7]
REKEEKEQGQEQSSFREKLKDYKKSC